MYKALKSHSCFIFKALVFRVVHFFLFPEMWTFFDIKPGNKNYNKVIKEAGERGNQDV